MPCSLTSLTRGRFVGGRGSCRMIAQVYFPRPGTRAVRNRGNDDQKDVTYYI
jgi:hypothetical protein